MAEVPTINVIPSSQPLTPAILESTANAALNGIRIAGRQEDSLWDIRCEDGFITNITQYGDIAAQPSRPPQGHLVMPSLCHPHVHLDKCFLLCHPKYSDLKLERGNFGEALELTSKAKSRFEHDDLMERGRALIEESISYGVTHMRAFVEVDEVVGTKCLDAGLSLRREFQDRCYVQLCVFAQDPIYSYPDGGVKMRQLLQDAASRTGVDVVGSTPYVEKSRENATANIVWIISLALRYGLLLDFHLDYNLDKEQEPMIHELIQQLKNAEWPQERQVTVGHCTRMTSFSQEEWQSLKASIGELSISFVGLPTSDLFMMGRPGDDVGGGERPRGTLQILQMIQKYGLNAAIGINNVGNAFTPQGNCDPLSLACLGVGIYQAGTQEDAEILFQCVSTRAKAAIGLPTSSGLDLEAGDHADFVIFDPKNTVFSFRQRKTIQDIVYDAGVPRITVKSGRITSR